MSSPSLSHDLWCLARAGDQEAYDRLFALQVDRLLVFIRTRLGLLRAKVEPEDVLQEAYLAAHRSFASFDYTEDGAFLRRLCRIVENRLADLADFHAARKRQAEPIPRSALTGPITALQRAENRQRIEHALSQLSEDHRQVILLRYFEGLTAEEAGDRLGRSAGAVRNLLARALVELGRLLKTDR